MTKNFNHIYVSRMSQICDEQKLSQNSVTISLFFCSEIIKSNWQIEMTWFMPVSLCFDLQYPHWVIVGENLQMGVKCSTCTTHSPLNNSWPMTYTNIFISFIIIGRHFSMFTKIFTFRFACYKIRCCCDIFAFIQSNK